MNHSASPKMRMSRYKGKFEKGALPRVPHDVSEAKPASETKSGKKQKKSSGSVILRIVLVTLLIILLLAGAVLIYANHMLGKMNQEVYTGNSNVSIEDLVSDAVGTEGLVSAEEDTVEEIEKVWEQFEQIKDQPLMESENDIVNYLLIGSDRRDKTSYGNSDSMIVVSLNKSTKKIHLTSLMRAIYVIMPEGSGHTDGMLNWAYAWGGPELLVDTVETNFKIDIDHYITVDFSSFEQIVDAVGGVPITLTSGEANFINKFTETTGAVAGSQYLNGTQALAYARCRSLDNDFKRTSRQRTVIEALIKTVGTLNLTQLNDLANALLPAISTDMSNTEIFAEVINVPAYATYPIDQRMLPIENEAGNSYTGMIRKYGAEMYAIDWSTNLPALEAFING